MPSDPARLQRRPTRLWRKGKWYTIIPLPTILSDGIALIGDEVQLANEFEWDDTNWFMMQKLANRWMERKGEAEEGISYVFRGIPGGYGQAVRVRVGGRVDRYVYGHPSGRPFRGTPEFFTHFCFLMDWETNRHSCSCELCRTLT